MVIECNEINQVINKLKIAFQTCKKIENQDLVQLVELVAAVNKCSNGGPNYDKLVAESFEGPTTITFPPNSFHSFSLSVMEGNITYQGFTIPKGSVKNIEFTTLNQTEIKFDISIGGKVLFEYLIEDKNGKN